MCLLAWPPAGMGQAATGQPLLLWLLLLPRLPLHAAAWNCGMHEAQQWPAGPSCHSSLHAPRPGLPCSDNLDDYVVHDPLLEAGKAKFNKQQQRAKKRQSEWAGRGQG